MPEGDPRTVLDQLIQERGEDYASLSRLIGRNTAYVQQFIKRGVPKRLSEKDRRLLARYFGVREVALGGPSEAETRQDDLVIVPRFDVAASAGPGAIAGDERAKAHLAFGAAWLRGLARGDPNRLSIIRVQGDSMMPNLADGDEILVDGSDVAGRLRDGIYVLRMDDALIVKRLAVNPAGRRVSVKSDNPAYPSWPDCDPAALDLIGRVVWAGRRIV